MTMPANRNLNFRPALEEFLTGRADTHYTVFCGGNNSGKSLVLKNMKLKLGRKGYMVGPQRFYHVHEISTQRFNAGDYESWDNQFRSNANNEEFNYEQNYIDLGRIIGGLKDAKRQKLFDLCGELIGNKFSLKRRDEENELSLRYVDMDGQNLSVGSTGTRLLMTLLGLCMDEQFEVMLIDEPELGLSPRIQNSLALFFADADRRKEYFPHLKGVFVATHSHLFLDRKALSNNFIIEKVVSDVSIRAIASMNELHELQFNLLGNSLEALFLPSAIVIVEGKTDAPYISKCIRGRFAGRNVVVIESQGDVKRAFKNLCSSLGDIQKSPFRGRTFVVLDSVHTAGTKADLVRMGAKEDNIVVWSKNGIEYLYPPSVMSSIFSCAEADLGNLDITDDEVRINGITRRKVLLGEEVLAQLDLTTPLPTELNDKLLSPLAAAIGS